MLFWARQASHAPMLSRYRRYAILAIVTAAAITTPTTDAYTCLLAGPLMILYEVSIALVPVRQRRAIIDCRLVLEAA